MHFHKGSTKKMELYFLLINRLHNSPYNKGSMCQILESRDQDQKLSYGFHGMLFRNLTGCSSDEHIGSKWKWQKMLRKLHTKGNKKWDERKLQNLEGDRRRCRRRPSVARNWRMDAGRCRREPSLKWKPETGEAKGYDFWFELSWWCDSEVYQ